MVLPGFGEQYVPMFIRLGLALAITAALAPVVATAVPVEPAQPLSIFLLIGGEAFIGLLIGGIARIIMSALHVAGTIIAFESGLAYALTIDPAQGVQGALIASFLSFLGVVAIFATRLNDNEPMTLYGFGEPTRDYVHVSDVARALTDSLGTAGTYNIATGTETSVRDVYDLARSAVPNSTSDEPELAPLRSGELQASCLDASLAASVLGGTPQLDVTTGIPSTVRSLLGD